MEWKASSSAATIPCLLLHEPPQLPAVRTTTTLSRKNIVFLFLLQHIHRLRLDDSDSRRVFLLECEEAVCTKGILRKRRFFDIVTSRIPLSSS
ncbi:UNVERIFIED_CONTAM: hypothetical protein FKN15_032678 [Acipenser sinensis]